MWVNPAFSRGNCKYFYGIRGYDFGNENFLQYEGCGGTANLSIQVKGNYGSVIYASKEILSDVDLQRWQHIAAVWDVNNGVWLYRDGVLVSSATGTTGALTLATQKMGYDFYGDIDDVRTYSRALSAGEIARLYQATKSFIGTLSVHKGQGDGTFNATPVEVDAGLEKGNVAWGDADGDGDLDILMAGSDGTNSAVKRVSEHPIVDRIQHGAQRARDTGGNVRLQPERSVGGQFHVDGRDGFRHRDDNRKRVKL
jgi:hypothetical protein